MWYNQFVWSQAHLPSAYYLFKQLLWLGLWKCSWCDIISAYLINLKRLWSAFWSDARRETGAWGGCVMHFTDTCTYGCNTSIHPLSRWPKDASKFFRMMRESRVDVIIYIQQFLIAGLTVLAVKLSLWTSRLSHIERNHLSLWGVVSVRVRRPKRS